MTKTRNLLCMKGPQSGRLPPSTNEATAARLHTRVVETGIAAYVVRWGALVRRVRGVAIDSPRPIDGCNHGDRGLAGFARTFLA